MKKTASILETIVLFLLLTIEAFGIGGQYYHFDKLGFSMNIPEDYVVITRGMAENDPLFKDYGLSYDEINSYFENNSIYMEALRTDRMAEIIITKESSSSYDFSRIDDKDLNETMSALAEMIESEFNASIMSSALYKCKNAKYININYKQVFNDLPITKIQYGTIFDNKAVNIVYVSNSGELDESAESTMKAIVDSISYDKPLITKPVNSSSTRDRLAEAGTRGAFQGALEGIIMAIFFGIIFAIARLFKKEKTTETITHTEKASITDAENAEMAHYPETVEDMTEYLLSDTAEGADDNISVMQEIEDGLLPTQNISSTDAATTSNQIGFCRFCGKKIPSDSIFCPYCGKK